MSFPLMLRLAFILLLVACTPSTGPKPPHIFLPSCIIACRGVVTVSTAHAPR